MQFMLSRALSVPWNEETVIVLAFYGFTKDIPPDTPSAHCFEHISTVHTFISELPLWTTLPIISEK